MTLRTQLEGRPSFKLHATFSKCRHCSYWLRLFASLLNSTLNTDFWAIIHFNCLFVCQTSKYKLASQGYPEQEWQSQTNAWRGAARQHFHVAPIMYKHIMLKSEKCIHTSQKKKKRNQSRLQHECTVVAPATPLYLALSFILHLKLDWHV